MAQRAPWLTETYPLDDREVRQPAEDPPADGSPDTAIAPAAPDDPVADAVPIASLDDFKALERAPVTELVFVPLLKRRLRVRAPTALDMQTARLATQTQKGNRTVPRADRDQATHLVYLCTITDTGDRFFPNGYIRELMAMPYGVIQPLAQVILRLAGLDEEANEREERDAF